MRIAAVFLFLTLIRMPVTDFPLNIGYTYAANKWKRMRSVIKKAFIYSVAVALAGAVLLFVCAVPVVKGFIDDKETVAYGQHFLRIICVTCPAVSVTMMIISVFQATGQKTRPMILSLLRKGGLDIPFMFLMNAAAGANGIPWATPIADGFVYSIQKTAKGNYGEFFGEGMTMGYRSNLWTNLSQLPKEKFSVLPIVPCFLEFYHIHL